MTTTDKEKAKALIHVIRHIAYMEGYLEGKSVQASNCDMRCFYTELKDSCEELVLHLQNRFDSITSEHGEELFPNG